MKKVLVIGAGNVGAHIIHAGISKNVGAEFYLLDTNQELEQSQVLDLKDTLLFSRYSKIKGISFNDPLIAKMDIVVITAGASQSPGETRCDLLTKNKQILTSIASQLQDLKSSAIVLLVTNPVDILTHIAYECFDLPKNQILGTGTLLDSARLRWRIADHLHINSNNIHGYVMGEHGDSEFVAWSTVKPKKAISEQTRKIIEDQVINAAYEIIQGKGATYFGISGATTHILKAIIHNTREIMPVSTVYPHTDHISLVKTPLGIPAVLGKNGIEFVPELNLSDKEMKQLEASADKLYSLYCTCSLEK